MIRNPKLSKPITIEVLSRALEDVPQSLGDLFAELTERGYTATSVAETRAMLESSPKFERHDDLWRLSSMTRHASTKGSRRPVEPQPEPTPTYRAPPPRLTYTWLTGGPAGQMKYPDFDRRLRETLSLAPYEGLAFYLPSSADDRGIERKWRMHRIWYEGTITFCFWTVTNRRPLQSFLHDHGWHLWSVDEPARWDDDCFQLEPHEFDEGGVAVATWRSSTSIAAAHRVGSWFADTLRMPSLQGVEFRIFQPAVREEQVAEVAKRRRAHARTHDGRKDPIRGTCRACGQPLSDDVSLARGYGPVCYNDAVRSSGDDTRATDAWYWASAPAVSEFRRTIAVAAREVSAAPTAALEQEAGR